jgi:hypothetical protein
VPQENKVKDHARKLLEKYTGEPFFESAYARGSGRMSNSSFKQGLTWLDQHFTLLRCEDDQLPSIDWVLDLSRVAVLRCASPAPCISLGDAKGSLGDTYISLGDAKSSLGDAKSSLGDAKSSLGDTYISLVTLRAQSPHASPRLLRLPPWQTPLLLTMSKAGGGQVRHPRPGDRPVQRAGPPARQEHN